MNIWCISKYASPQQYSKMPARLFYLCSEWVKLGHNVRLFTSDSNHLANYPETNTLYNIENEQGVDIHWLKTKKYKKTASIARIVSWFDFEFKLFAQKTKHLEKPDVVLVSALSIFSIVYGYWLKRRYNATLVFEIRDIWPLTMTEESGFSKWHPLVIFIGLIEWFGYKVSDLVVGTMPNLSEHVNQICPSQKNFYCAPLGFNPPDFPEINHKNDYFSNLVPHDKFIVGYAGSMGITNALEPFINTIKKMKENPDVYFVLLGSGDLKEGFQTSLADYKNVSFLDRIPQDEVKNFLSVCDVLYLSTHDSKVWDYGQSMNKVVEYMLASKPIIASYKGFPSMINEAECGFFVDNSEPNLLMSKIEEIFELSEEERIEMGRNGRDWIFKHRSYNLVAKNYIDAISEVTVQ